MVPELVPLVKGECASGPGGVELVGGQEASLGLGRPWHRPALWRHGSSGPGVSPSLVMELSQEGAWHVPLDAPLPLPCMLPPPRLADSRCVHWWAAVTKQHRQGSRNNRHVFPTALEAGDPKPRCWKGCLCWRGPTSWLADSRLLAMPFHGLCAQRTALVSRPLPIRTPIL